MVSFQSFPRFWPTSEENPKQYGDLTVQLDAETECNEITTRVFVLSPYPVCIHIE